MTHFWWSENLKCFFLFKADDSRIVRMGGFSCRFMVYCVGCGSRDVTPKNVYFSSFDAISVQARFIKILVTVNSKKNGIKVVAVIDRVSLLSCATLVGLPKRLVQRDRERLRLLLCRARSELLFCRRRRWNCCRGAQCISFVVCLQI